MTERPDFVTDEHLKFLDDLKMSGVINMFEAWGYVEDQFDLDHEQAKQTVIYWVETFSDRHPETA